MEVSKEEGTKGKGDFAIGRRFPSTDFRGWVDVLACCTSEGKTRPTIGVLISIGLALWLMIDGQLS